MIGGIPTFVGALSFEQRAVGAVKGWTVANPGGRVVLVDYGSEATPGESARDRREGISDRIVEMVGPGSIVERVRLSPYSMRAMAELVGRVSAGSTSISFDITCVTRPHVIAIAGACLRVESQLPCSIAYTSPLGYGSIGTPYPDYGWRDSLILPLGEDASLDNQGVSLGVLLLGFDVDRLSVAFDQIETDAGVIVVSETPGRPDFHRLAISRSRPMAAYLRSLAMTGDRGDAIVRHLDGPGWSIANARVDTAMSDAREVVGRIVSAACSGAKPAPVILYPFGPKVVVFAFAYELIRTHADYSWAVYPVPHTHPLDYSTGVGLTRWITLGSTAST